jgi:predicted lipoprotein with Yx(FWY)xxD motif
MALTGAEKAILMTAGSEKLQSEHRYNFELEDGESKIIPLYFQKKDTDGEDNTNFDGSSNWPAIEIEWKSRCAGGYYSLEAYNEDAKGAVLGLTWLVLNKHNHSNFDTAVDITDNILGSKTSVISSIVQDTLKNDDISRNFVPHIKRLPMQPRELHFEEGNMPTGKGTAPIETPFLKALMVSNLTPITTSKVSFQIEQNIYQYAPGVVTSSRGKVLHDTEA